MFMLDSITLSINTAYFASKIIDMVNVFALVTEYLLCLNQICLPSKIKIVVLEIENHSIIS